MYAPKTPDNNVVPMASQKTIGGISLYACAMNSVAATIVAANTDPAATISAHENSIWVTTVVSPMFSTWSLKALLLHIYLP